MAWNRSHWSNLKPAAYSSCWSGLSYSRHCQKTDLSPRGRCLGAPSPPTPLNGYTFTLFRRHPRRHRRSSIRLQAIHIRCRSGSRQLASRASRNLAPPAPGCVPCPDGLRSSLHGTAGEDCRVNPPGRLSGAAIPVPPTRGTVGVAPHIPGITVSTGAIVLWLLVTPARCLPSGAGCSRPASIS